MGKILTKKEKQSIYEEIREHLAEELEVDLDDISEDTKIIDDLGGDSLIYLELIEEFKKQYDIALEVRTIGQYLLKRTINTVGEMADAVYNIIEKGELLIEEMQKQI